MSEYQYYEFQAIDRSLTSKEMAELRKYSTRARITPTSFVNDYAWGSFKGNEDAWMEKYFDAFLYLANWGSHVLKMRLPSHMLGLVTAKKYCGGDSAFVRGKARSEREAPIAREKHLESLAGREPKMWAEVDALIATKQPKSYDQAVRLLLDLREFDARGKGGDFQLRIGALRQAHSRKPTLIERLGKAGL